MDVNSVSFAMLVASILSVFHGADGQLICNVGVKSTIDSLNSQLGPVKTQTCSPSQVCLVATMRAIYQGKTGQGKVGRCASSSNCDDSSGCTLARFSLPFGASYLECKADCCRSNNCNSLSVSKGSSITRVSQTVATVVSFQLIMLLW